MIVLYAIAIIGYIIISIITTTLFVYADRKTGEPAQNVYKEDNFYEYCMMGFLFPISLPLLIIGTIGKFVKIIIVTIVETKIAIEKK